MKLLLLLVACVSVQAMDGKVFCGYQGWFNAEGDGAERGWTHWTKGKGTPTAANIKVDLWPDVSELGPDERFATGLRFPDGRVAEVFSSFKRETVLRHFRWMRDYGIDGAFVQRFAVGLQDPRVRRHTDTVLAHCREGAKQYQRDYVVMYDLTGLRADRVSTVLDDWRQLTVTNDTAYLRHRGKPLVTVWGVGFNDDRAYTLAECRQLVEALKRGGCSVMLGVPTYWRELKRDAVADPALHDIIRLADIVSPWTVGRYADVQNHAKNTLPADIAWCRKNKLDYLPVVFPGFSWHNMKGDQLDKIPRRRGAFLWSQFAAVKRAGLNAAYVAMFDEVDEGTAIFKCEPQPPAGFLGLEGLPSDYYLRLTGLGGKLLRGKIPTTDRPPGLTNAPALVR
ncbi:MAG: xylosidase/arabinosidase [Verrucomicrobia bacterium]|nr:xylosidase/arabinosidase [Verrucomicrobiota bacterium]